MAASPTIERMHDSHSLEQAFSLFTQVSQQLSDSYAALQTRTAQLSKELSIANGELNRELTTRKALLDALPAGVLMLDHNERINMANPAAIAILGDNILHNTWPRIQTKLRSTPCHNEWLVDNKRIVVAIEPLNDHHQLIVLHDISEAHAMRETFSRQQRLATMGETAAMLAHQLRTPLSSALLYAESIQREDINPLEKNRFAQAIMARLHDVEKQVSTLLQFVRGHTTAWSNTQHHTLIQRAVDTIEPVLAAHAVQFLFWCTEENISLICQPDAISNAIVCLLENAHQACMKWDKADGNITNYQPQIRLACYSKDNALVISVQDNGPGIAPEVQTRLFEPFFTTREQGTGLGLAIVKQIAATHGGHVEVISDADTGSEFQLHLPLQTTRQYHLDSPLYNHADELITHA